LRAIIARGPIGSAVLLSVMDVANALGCGRTLVYELIGSGQLETVKLGRLRRIPADALDELVRHLRSASSLE
jgi:excisionase family DNA binding protein